LRVAFRLAIWDYYEHWQRLEESQMKKRSYWVWGWLEAALLLLLAIAYACLSFAPTGYGSFVETNKGTIQRVEDILNPRPAPPTSKTPSITSWSLSVETPSESPTSNTLVCDERFFKEKVLSPWRRNMQLRGLLPSGYMVEWSDCHFLAEHFDVSAQMTKETVINDKRLGLFRRPRSEVAAPEESADRKNLSQDRIAFYRGSFRGSLEPILSNLETCLLNQPLAAQNLSGQKESQDFLASVDGGWLCAAAILRATWRGDGDKAARLLESWLEGTRLAHFRAYPQGIYGDSWRPIILIPLLFELVQTDQFPAEGFARVQAVLERTLLDEKALADFRVEYAVRWAEVLRPDLKNIRPEENAWHYFFNGRVEGFVNAALRPALARQIDNLAVGWAQGDIARIENAENKLKALAWGLNSKSIEDFYWRFYGQGAISTDETPSSVARLSKSEIAFRKRREREENYSKGLGARFNQWVDMARLVCASARFRRAQGRCPESVAELVPTYLDADMARTSFGETTGPSASNRPFDIYAIYKAESFEALRAPDGPKDTRSALFRAVMMFARDHPKRFLTSAEELRPYAADDAQFESFRKCFVPIPAIPLFCRFHLNTWRRTSQRLPAEIDEGANSSNAQTAQETQEAKEGQRPLEENPNLVDGLTAWPPASWPAKELIEVLFREEGKR